MRKLHQLFRRVLGLKVRTTCDGRPLPAALEDAVPMVVVHDRRLTAGVFEHPRRKGAPSHYRVVAWRTYADKRGREHATLSLHRDEVDPALRLLAECALKLGR
jgi:hypothetical protein